MVFDQGRRNVNIEWWKIELIKKKLNQTKALKILDMNQKTLWSRLHGDTHLNVEEMIKISNLFECSIDEVIKQFGYEQ